MLLPTHRGRSLVLPIAGGVLILAHSAVVPADRPGDGQGEGHPPKIPLCAGLTVVGAVSEPQGDYESIVRVDSVNDDTISLTYSTNIQVGTSIRHIRVSRIVRRRDLRDARLSVPWFNTRAPVTIPGSTAFGTSAAVLRGLKTAGVAELAVVDRGGSALPADHDVHPNIYDFQALYKLQRLGSSPVAVPVTVNGTKVDLPAIHARGEHMGDTAEFHFLDDEANPISLRFQSTPFGSTAPDTETRAVKISYRCSDWTDGATPLERALVEAGRVDVYDIYFDFNSDRIREESQPTLDEIAEVLRRHPDWHLTIEGHTDSIGSDAANLNLSRRRAAAVKQALVTAHRVAADRLTTSGHGEARPRDRNDTLEGRARNRRVELVRSAR